MPAPCTVEECDVVLLSPFEIHFSQTRIRSEFQDGRTLEEAMPDIRAVPHSGVADAPASLEGAARVAGATVSEAAEAAPRAADEEPGGRPTEVVDKGASQCKDFMLMSAPFPRIEVTKWRCKLREPDGSPKLDPSTGLELYSHEEIWFTFDNRRLYCLQKAAAKLWPREVRCEVVEIPPTLARTRELRKFDTRTFGYSIIVGRRDNPSPENWSWRASVGLPEEQQPQEGVARQKSLRWRGQRRGGASTNRRASGSEDVSQGSQVQEFMRSAMLFFLVYLGLRLAVSVFRHYFSTLSKEAPA